jgi:D-glycero-alpha-D-manno-heptose 1-phosphate guanylyltransferase
VYEAIILAGGFGTRLRETVPDLPKPMAPVAGRPFLAWQLDYLINLGVSHFILSVGYKAETIKSYFGQAYKNAQISYAEETTPLGTGGAIKFALSKAKQDRVFVFNGDTLCEVDLFKIRSIVCDLSNAIGIAVKHVDDAGRYGAISFDEDSKLVLAFGEKSASGPGYINAGIYDIPTTLFENILDESPFSFETQVIKTFVGKDLYANKTGNFFIDIGIPDDYELAQTKIPSLFSRNI